MVVGDNLYVGSCSGKFYSFKANSGDLLWEYDVSTDGASQFHGNPLIVDSVIVFGTDEGSQGSGALYALNRYTGNLIWKSAGHTGLASEPAIGLNSILYAITRDDSLLAINIRNGKPIWSVFSGWQRGDAEEYESAIAIPRLVSSPQSIDSSVIMIGRNNVLYKLRMEDGALEDTVLIDHIVTSDPALMGNSLLLGLSNQTFALYDPEKETLEKLYDLPYMALGGIAIDEDRIVFLAGHEDDRPRIVSSLRRVDGVIEWVVSIQDDDSDAYWYVPRIHIRGVWIIVGSTTGRVVAVDTESGEEKWEYHCDGPIRGIGHSDSMLFIGTFRGRLYALSVTE